MVDASILSPPPTQSKQLASNHTGSPFCDPYSPEEFEQEIHTQVKEEGELKPQKVCTQVGQEEEEEWEKREVFPQKAFGEELEAEGALSPEKEEEGKMVPYIASPERQHRWRSAPSKPGKQWDWRLKRFHRRSSNPRPGQLTFCNNEPLKNGPRAILKKLRFPAWILDLRPQSLDRELGIAEAKPRKGPSNTKGSPWEIYGTTVEEVPAMSESPKKICAESTRSVVTEPGKQEEEKQRTEEEKQQIEKERAKREKNKQKLQDFLGRVQHDKEVKERKVLEEQKLSKLRDEEKQRQMLLPPPPVIELFLFRTQEDIDRRKQYKAEHAPKDGGVRLAFKFCKGSPGGPSGERHRKGRRCAFFFEGEG